MLRLTVLIPFALIACVSSGDESMYVVNNTAAAGTTCTFTGAPDQPFLSHGIIQFESSLPYILHPLIQSRVTGLGVGSGSGSGTSTSDDISRTIQLLGADITLTIEATTVQTGDQFTTTQVNTNLPAFSSRFSGAITPGGTVNVGFDLIPAGTLRQIGAMSGANLAGGQNFSTEVLAQVTVKGQLNGNALDAVPFSYPVTVCSNCVVVNQGACPLTTAPRMGDSCNPFQDGTVDCCTTAAGQLTCPGSTM